MAVRKTNRLAGTAVWSALVALILFAAPSGAAEPGSVEVVRVPDGGIQPQVQADARGRVHMIYFKGDARHGDVFYVRADDGAAFSKPLRVNSQPQSAVAIGTVRGPRLAIGKGGRVHVAWMGSDLAEPKAGARSVPMLYSRLNDAGDGFEAQRNVIRAHAGLDGGGAVAADADGNVYVAWHAPESGTGEANRRVWLAPSTDDGKTFAPETAASPPGTGACGCCGMNISAGPNGHVYMLYRSATEAVNRDVYLLASSDRGQTFEVTSIDPWKIGACVMSTSHFASDGDGVLAAWETQSQIRLRRVGRDGANPAEIIVPPGKGGDRKHPAIAVNRRGEFIVAWAEGTGWNKGGRAAWQVFDKDAKPLPGKSGRAEGLPVWGVPAVFASPDDTFKLAF